MVLVNERISREVFEFQNGNLTVIEINIEQYKTFWKLSARFVDWQSPVAIGWKYGKKECKTERNAVVQFLHKLHERY